MSGLAVYAPLESDLPMERTRPRLGYFRAPHSLLYGLVLTAPLLAIYEVGTWRQNFGKTVQVMNGADVLLQKILTLNGLVTLQQMSIALLLGLLGGLVIEWRKHRIPLAKWMMVLMLIESVVLSFFLGPLSNWLLRPYLPLSALIVFPSIPDLRGLGEHLVSSAGAGFYEELVFRLLLVGGLMTVFRLLGSSKIVSGIVAVVISAAIFSGIHHLGMLGDPFTTRVFLFRFSAGLVLNAIYALRGFAIAAWTHALYDLWVMTNMI